MDYITFNEHKSSDFGLTYESAVIGAPAKRKTELTIPFRDSSVDMSLINGKQTFDDRTLEYKFWKKVKNVSELRRCNFEITNWLLGVSGKMTLQDSKNVYEQRQKDGTTKIVEEYDEFEAECTAVDASESTAKILKLKITFKAAPYRKHFIRLEPGVGTWEELI